MRSIRRELVLWLSIGTAVLSAVAGLVSGRVVENRLRQDFDEDLLATAQTIMSVTEQDAGRYVLEFSYESMPQFSTKAPLEYFETWSDIGEIVERSRSLAGAGLESPFSRDESPQIWNALLPDGRPGRLLQMTFVPQAEEESASISGPQTRSRQAVLVLARGRDELERFVRWVYLTDLAIAVGLALALALCVEFVLRRGLAPLAKVARDVGALDERSLETRIEVSPAVDELDPIVRRLNLLLERLQAAFERERRFSGDVAHELRTPVAELRTLAEVGGRWSGDAALASALFADTAAVAERMERVVAQMMTLARAEAGQEPIESSPFDLAELIDECVVSCSPVTRDRRISIELHLDRPLPVFEDRNLLAVILRNLLENAVAHGPEDGTITVEAHATSDGEVRFTVTNAAPELQRSDLEAMFGRFWTKDVARSNARHSGLGLSLVRTLAGLLGIEVEARRDEIRGLLTLAVQLPARGLRSPV
ncbi:MAG: ATP-binding protein [Thermoanaerobaculia bacterium]